MGSNQNTINDCFRVIAERAKAYLESARAEDELRDPFATAYDLSDALGQDLATHIAIQLRAVLYDEGLVPQTRALGDSGGFTSVPIRIDNPDKG